MIKSFTATTREIEDAQAAVAEIKAALNIEKNLLKNSLGIVSCFSDFEESGVLKAVCQALPFDCIGSTTCMCAAGREIDQIILVITVLTSDDCSFKTAAVPITDKYADTINSALTGMLNQSAEKPALFLGYFPLMNNVSGDMILAAIDRVTGGIPIFGTVAIDHTMDYSTSKTIHNGEMFRESAVLCAIFGNPDFSFDVASIDENKIKKQKGIITGSYGNILVSVNNKPAVDYFEEIGVTKTELSNGLGLIPLVIDQDATKPIARAVFALTPDGNAVCGGIMPVNAALSIARIGRDDILNTTETTLKTLVAKDGCILSYSCLARYLAMGADYKAEGEKVQGLIKNARYHFACSSGEICPLPDASGRLKNYFHNYTNVFCRIS